jgi:hypothetical protein
MYVTYRGGVRTLSYTDIGVWHLMLHTLSYTDIGGEHLMLHIGGRGINLTLH